MPSDRPRDLTSEREKTDHSLRTEREKTDRALDEKQTAVEEDADLVVRRARDAADAIVGAARAKADDELSHRSPDETQATIDAERAEQDETLRGERATADEALQEDRRETARALARLLPLERDKTDRYLLTERARSDAALANRDDFLAMVSHDLRNLLGGIVTSAALIAKGAAEDDQGKRTLIGAGRIQRYAARMNRLIGDLVDVASIEIGKLAMVPTRADAMALVEEAVDIFQGAAAAKEITLTAEMVERPIEACFDHDRMLQVMANLIANSIKFTPAGGAIQVRGERTATGLCVCVTDNGAGIPPDMLEPIFEPFFQVGKNDRRGVGLGLYISRSIVQAHGGRIWAESTLGTSTRLSFVLPVS
ncbi:hypothetical protein BH18ACI5_BH18ACI5_27500 [soil metagenome]